MQVNFLTIIISMIVSFAILSLLTSQNEWGILAGLAVGVSGFKWLRIKKQETDDEIEYDERVNLNIKQYSFQTFSIANLLLLVYLLISQQVFKIHSINANYLIIYLSITFIAAFYIVPLIAKRR
ncbi:hypothetical protein [Neobacillus dielmonensis]|uniref:hypothetical protein n=1 Tax=Neobacillus dielmonensis TaxID=1347369 RepID=UPI000A96389A|nr:hypothetical protein [Neobacillus dielmonensis]